MCPVVHRSLLAGCASLSIFISFISFSQLKKQNIMNMNITQERNKSILMLPWLAHGHISPFLELAKKLSSRNFNIYLCSTPINLISVKKSITPKYQTSIKLVELCLPSSPNLPPHYHTTNGLPPNLMVALKDAFELSSPAFTKILTAIKPDLLLYDFNQPWAAAIASSHNIPVVQFLTAGAAVVSNALHMITKPGQDYPFPFLLAKNSKVGKRIDFDAPPEEIKKDIVSFLGAMNRSQDIILSKTFKEIEGKYINHLSGQTNKRIVPVGPLVQEIEKEEDAGDEYKHIIEWLDKKKVSSVLFVSFGSEYFLSKEEMEEVAKGLDMSSVDFIWVVRFPVGERVALKDALPQKYMERIGRRGMVVEGWAPQAKILQHKSTCGFVSHCGWNSFMESIKFGVPMICVPMQLDQPLNARVIEEIGVGVQVEELRRDMIAEVIRKVVAEEGGESIRRKARKLSELIEVKGDEEIDNVAKELLNLISNNNE